jgi:hypothetical protein
MTPEQHTRHNQLFDQFIYELFCEPARESIKSKGGLSKRAKFLSKKENLKGPHEKRVEMAPMQSAHEKSRGRK